MVKDRGREGGAEGVRAERPPGGGEQRRVWAQVVGGRGQSRSAMVDKQGRFEIEGLVPGFRYRLSAWSQGYKTAKQDVEAGAEGVAFTLESTGEEERGK